MKFSRVYLLVILIVGSGSVWLVNGQPAPESHLRHGLKVYINPNTGKFEKPDPVSTSLLTKARGLISSPRYKETPSIRNNGGYSVNLEHHYRLSGQQDTKRPGS